MEAELIMSVRDMQDKKLWHWMRNNGIGGSDAGTIVGDNPWKSPYALWLEKTGQLVPEDISDKDPVYWGTVLEDVVAREFSKRTGYKVRRQGMMRNNKNLWMLANVDRMLVGEPIGLECKTTNAFSAGDWKEDGLPNSYYWQCQHYMMVTGLSAWYIAVLIGGQHFDYKLIPRNNADIAYLYGEELKFWNCVQKMTPPPIDGSKSTAQALGDQYLGGRIEPIDLPKEAADIIKLYDGLKDKKKRVEEELKKAENQLKCMMGDDEIGLCGDRKVTWKTTVGRTTIDSKKLKSEYPDVWEECKKVGNPTRTFKVK